MLVLGMQFDEIELKNRDKMIRWLDSDTENREKLQCLMQYLGRKEVDGAVEFLYGGMWHDALLLIDEIFRGTNSAERVAASAALLKYLLKRSCKIIVATHDIEIIDEVHGCFTVCHFSEKIERAALSFDYIMKPGVLEKPNGIHILEYLGYPEEITEQALQMVSMHTTAEHASTPEK